MNVSVRNNVQPGVSNRPIDMVATRIPADQIGSLVHEAELTPDVIWVNGGVEKQALILAREDANGNLSFRYQPVKKLTQDASGRFNFEAISLQPDLPLRIFEDQQLLLPAGSDRETWLSEWHTDVEWLDALHRTNYSNGLIGLYEEVARHASGRLDSGRNESW